jgi:CelD/BcsL family acetyltransferase involved in cellulose biosynthesis
MLSCEIVDRVEELARYEHEWDRLAVASGQPSCRPAWLRCWWNARCARADRPARALRVAVVTDAGRLLALLPMFLVDRTALLPDMRMLGEGQFWNGGPLLSPQAPPDVLGLLARALTESRPRPARLIFAHVPREAPWPQELARPGRGRVWLRPGGYDESLVIAGAPSYAEWFAARPQDWRAEFRRRERRAAEQGFRVRRADSAEAIARDVRELARLHHARLQGRSLWLLPGVEDALREACMELVAGGGARMWSVSRNDQVIAATLFACAGDTSQVLLTAFDPRWRGLGPGLLSVVAGIRRQLEDGNQTIDFGYGAFPYKQALAPAREPLARFELFPLGWRYPLARTRWPGERQRQQLDRLRRALKR